MMHVFIFCEQLLMYQMAIIWARLVQQIQIGPWILAGSRLDQNVDFFFFCAKVNLSYFLISFVYILILLLQNLETHDMIYTEPNMGRLPICVGSC